MAREIMVTRTIKTTVAQMLCVNTESKQTEIVNVDLPRTYEKQEDIVKFCNKHYDGKKEGWENLKAVSVIDTVIKESLYGMPESEFIAKATILPPRSKEN